MFCKLHPVRWSTSMCHKERRYITVLPMIGMSSLSSFINWRRSAPTTTRVWFVQITCIVLLTRWPPRFTTSRCNVTTLVNTAYRGVVTTATSSDFGVTSSTWVTAQPFKNNKQYLICNRQNKIQFKWNKGSSNISIGYKVLERNEQYHLLY